MSSFVSKVLKHAGDMEKKAAHEQLDVLLRRLRDLELEVHQLAEDKYTTFRPSLAEAQGLSEQVSRMEGELMAAEDKINTEIKSQLGVSTGEFQSLNQHLSEAKVKLAGLDYLAKIHDLLERTEEAVDSKKYSNAAVALTQLESLFKRPLTAGDDKIPILVDMRRELVVQKSFLECKLSDAWSSSVTWNILGDHPARATDIMTNVTEVSLTISCKGNALQELQETVQGLHITNGLSKKMVVFSKRVKDYILPLLLESSEVDLEIKGSSVTKTLTITKSKDLPIELPLYSAVFTNLLTLLDHLYDLLLSLTFNQDNLDPSHLSDASTITDSVNQSQASVSGSADTLMTLLGSEVAQWLLGQLCRGCLAQAVPGSAKEIEGFQAVVQTTEKLQEKLVGLGFIPSHDRTLLDYVDNVNVLFANKKCQAILVQARELMCSSLHESVAVSEDKPQGEWPPLLPGGVKKGKRSEGMGDGLSENTLRLPKCRISQSVSSLVNCAYETLHEATESSPECALQMFYAVRGMFEAYCHIVPTHHAHSLEEFPQLAALHHNNCMFISHHLLSLGHQFSSLPLAPGAHVAPTFVDLINPVRRTGLTAFLEQVARQRSQLLECLDGANAFASVEEEAPRALCERALRQVDLQLTHLQRVWTPVLPVNVYKKTMGQLIRTLVDHMTSCVAALEDIAQEAAQTLIKLISPLEASCGQLLVGPGEVAQAVLLKHVVCWTRLTEVKVLLDASLSDIADRWADGKGPLALAFSAKEVKQMVRALFQNTDRRAHVLAGIR